MKKITSTAVFAWAALAAICLTTGCLKPASTAVVACIYGVPSPATVGVTETFASCSYYVDAYFWRFGDSTTAYGDSAVHVYSKPGVYYGSLTVWGGKDSSTERFVVVVSALASNQCIFRGNLFNLDTVLASPAAATLTGSIYDAGVKISTLSFRFASLPATSGNYAVTPNSTPATDQVYVTVNIVAPGNPQVTYSPAGSHAATAAVTVSGGKISISLPSIEVVNQSQASDSAALSAIAVQTQ